MRVAIDTSVLAYAEGVGDAERCRVAIGLIERLPEPAVLLPAQVLGEDLQHGFTWRGVTIVNPFLPEESPLLAAILAPDG